MLVENLIGDFMDLLDNPKVLELKKRYFEHYRKKLPILLKKPWLNKFNR